LSHGSQRLQGAFVVVEMAMALVLLIGGGLMLRSLVALWSVDPGFNPQNVLVFSVSLPPSQMSASPAANRAHLGTLYQTFESVPGIRAVSLSWAAIPMASEDDELFWLENEPKPSTRTEKHGTLSYTVEPGYLKVMGIPLLEGRFFASQDTENSPLVVVIDDVFARKYFPDQDPVGKYLYLDNHDGAKAEIIGVVRHVKQWGLDSDDAHSLRAELYSSYMQLPDSAMAVASAGTTVIARYEGTASATTNNIRQASRQMNGDQLVYGFQTMEEIISGTLAARRSLLILLGVFAALALTLSGVGIYGVVSYLVGQRTHEIGIRMALGAKQRDVLGLVLAYGAKMAVLGVALGLAAAVGLTRLLVKSSMLFKVSATDPLTFGGVAVLLTIAALAATYLPARCASRVDPMVALRYE
jgi:predicted permease